MNFIFWFLIKIVFIQIVISITLFLFDFRRKIYEQLRHFLYIWIFFFIFGEYAISQADFIDSIDCK